MVLLLPENIIGQGIGFNMSSTGVMSFLPLLIYKTGITVQKLQLVGAGLVISSLVYYYPLCKFKKNFV